MSDASAPPARSPASAWRDLSTVAGHELRLLTNDVSPTAVLIVMPVILILFMRNGLFLQVGGRSLDGVYQAVPGLATMFAFFLVGYAGFAFFREHGWHTWDRLRASGVSGSALVVAKSLPYVGMSIVQLTLLLGVGAVFLGMDVRGSYAALALLVVLLATTAVSSAVALFSLVRTMEQLYAISYLMAVLLGGVGGAFAPASSYPAWVEAVAHVAPQFWAIEGMREVIVSGGGLADVTGNLLALAGFTVVFCAVAAWRFDISAEKQSWVD